MKKVFDFKVNEGRLFVEVEMVQVKTNSAITGLLGEYSLLKMQGMLKSNEGLLLRTGNLSDVLEQLIDEDELANEIISLWEYNQQYVAGTLRQFKKIGNPTFKELMSNSITFKKAVATLKEANLLNDRGVDFGGKMAIIPLPVEILDLATNLLV